MPGSIPRQQMPSKAYQRVLFIVLYLVFALIVFATIAWAVALERANDRETRAEHAIQSLRNITPPPVTKPNPITLQKAKEAASLDVNRKLEVLNRELRQEIQEATQTAQEAHAKAGLALDKADKNSRRIKNLTGD